MNDPLGLFDEGASNDPLGLFTEPKKKAGLGTSIHVYNEHAANAIDKYFTSLYGAGHNYLGNPDKADEIFKAMDERTKKRLKNANPNDEEIGLGGKIAGALATLPVQIAAMPFSPADTGQTMLQEGETLPRAVAGAGIDTVGNAVGIALPGSKGLTIPGKAVSGGLINAAQDTATRAAIAAIAEKESTKELLGPSLENAAVAGVVGAGAGALHGPGKARPVQADPLGLFKEPEAPQKSLVNQTEMEMPNNHFIPDSRKLSVDENGMPIDFAKSMDVQESGRKGQPDLFDETYADQTAKIRALQEGPKVADEMNLRDQQMEQMYAQRQPQLEAEHHQQEIAINQEKQLDLLTKLEEDLREKAYKPQGDGQGPKTRSFNRARRGAGGAIDVQAIAEGLKGLKEGLINKLDYLKSWEGTFTSKALKEAEAILQNPDSKSKIVFMPPELFHQLAEKRQKDFNSSNERRESVRKGLQSPDGLDDLPYLKGSVIDGKFHVSAHNGRHRMDVFKEQGIERVPVRLNLTDANKFSSIVGQNDPNNKKYVYQPTDKTDIENALSSWFDDKPDTVSSSPKIYVPRSQRGGIDFQGIGEGLQKLIPNLVEAPTPLKDIVGKNAIPADPKPAEVVARALKEGKDADVWNVTKYTESGGTLAAMSRKSALVKGVSEIVQNAQKKADLYTRKTVVPVEQQFRRMGMKEIESLAQVMKEEMFNEKLYTAEQLEARGLSDKQLSTYAGMRQMFEDSLELQNKARGEQGLKPITKVEHYMSSRWTGDFRQPIRDAEGKLVWYLAADTKGALNKQVKTLLEQFPGYKADAKESHTVKAGRMRNDLQGMYTTMVDILGRDDPSVQRIKDAYEASIAADSFKAMGQKKHFEHKGNIRGFIGDRPGANPRKEALAMFQEQVQYAKNAYKWAALQEAGTKVKAILSDEQLATQQPKNVEYAREYFKDNLGQGTAKWVDGIENAFRDAGISPAVVDKYVGSVKSFFITQKLAVSLGYTAANVLQVMNTVPHLVDVMVKEGGNPVKALASGILAGTGMTSGHYLNKLGGDFESLTKELPFLTEAFKYAEDNGITSRSIYDESPINQRGAINKSLEIAGKTLSIPETWVRSMAYMSFVQMLKDTKAYKDNTKLFQRAEELTNAAMVDYRAGERPIGFSKLGIAGNALNTLQTFPANLYNQYRYFAKEAIRGNPVPLLTMLSLQVAMAGAMGLPGFNDLDKLWGWAKEHMPDAAWAKVKDYDPKLAILENFGETALYGAVSTGSGVSMTSRLSAPGGFDMLQAPGGPIVDLAKQAGSVVEAAASPNETTLAQAARNITPTGLQGYMETGPLKDQFAVNKRPDGRTMYKKATDLADRAGQYARTPEEETIRKLGLRSQRETLHNEVNYKIGQIEKQTNERSKGMVEKYYDAVRRGDTKKATDIQKLYTSLNGKAINDEQFNNNLMKEYTTAFERKSATAKEKIEALKGMARIRKIMENQ